MTAPFGQLLRPKSLKLSLTSPPFTPHMRSVNKSCWFCFQNMSIQPLVTTPQLPPWFKPPSSLAWIFAVASPCFLSCSPVIYPHRVAIASMSLLFSESSIPSLFIQSKSPSPCRDLHDPAQSGRVAWLTGPPFPFPSHSAPATSQLLCLWPALRFHALS